MPRTGRPKLPPEQRRTEAGRVAARFTARELLALRREAAQRGISLAALIREALRPIFRS